MYLFDTNIVSVLAAAERRAQEEAVYDWLMQVKQPLFLSAISFSEMEAGIAKAERTGATTKADRLREWLVSLEHSFAQYVLPLDLKTAQITGRLLDKARGLGTTPAFEDAAIAATALRHNLAVATRNVKHFRMFDAPLFNPYDGAA